VPINDSLAISNQPPDRQMELPENLIVQGKEVWVRDSPVTGVVILKLNTGDTCRVLEKGPFQIIRSTPSYWYKIDYKGSEGWLFGSQSNLPRFQYDEDCLVFWSRFQSVTCPTCTSEPSEGAFSSIEKRNGEDPSEYREVKTTWRLVDLGKKHMVISISRDMMTSAAHTTAETFIVAYYPGVQWFVTKGIGRGALLHAYPTERDIVFISKQTEQHSSGAAGDHQSWLVYRLDLEHPSNLDSLQILAETRSGVFLNELDPGEFTSAVNIEPLQLRTLRVSTWTSEFEGSIEQIKRKSESPQIRLLSWDRDVHKFIEPQ